MIKVVVRNVWTSELVFFGDGVYYFPEINSDLEAVGEFDLSPIPPAATREFEFRFHPTIPGLRSISIRFRVEASGSTGQDYDQEYATLRAFVDSDDIRRLYSPNPANGGNYGLSIDLLPDVNGDGRDEILIGAPGEYGPGGNTRHAGKVYILDASSSEVIDILESPEPTRDAKFGVRVRGSKDLNGDGAGDFAVSISNRKVRVFSGKDLELLYSLPDPTSDEYDLLAPNYLSVPDLDGDGFPEWVVNRGARDVHLLVYSGNSRDFLYSLKAEGPSYSHAGSLALVPDITGDGYPELIAAAELASSTGEDDDVGRCYLYDLRTETCLRTFISPSPTSKEFGRSVLGLPDINGNGYSEIAVVGDFKQDYWEDDEGLIDYNYRSERIYIFDAGTGELLNTIASPDEERSAAFGYSMVSGESQFPPMKADFLVAGNDRDQYLNWIYRFSPDSIFPMESIRPPDGRSALFNRILTLPDIDGDGREELIISSPEDDGFDHEGMIFDSAGTIYILLSSYREPPPPPSPKLVFDDTPIVFPLLRAGEPPLEPHILVLGNTGRTDLFFDVEGF
ncbi:MAG: FG-GAP repeat protein, partial [Candidatus Omnitrophica bacterium]|nr:FG-GAP repeat protein [Candidatus Omnitrophota bacterium]